MIVSKMINVKDKLFTAVSTFVQKINLKLLKIAYGKNLKCRGLMIIRNRGKVTLGNDVRVNSADWANPIGYAGKTELQIFANGNLSIGNRVGMSSTAITCANSITIEDDVFIGAGCKIYDTDFHPLNPGLRYGEGRDDSATKTASIRIKRGAFIGGGVFVLKGITIGENAVVGAGSVVTRDVPDREVWAGNPARFIKKLEA